MASGWLSGTVGGVLACTGCSACCCVTWRVLPQRLRCCAWLPRAGRLCRLLLWGSGCCLGDSVGVLRWLLGLVRLWWCLMPVWGLLLCPGCGYVVGTVPSRSVDDGLIWVVSVRSPCMWPVLGVVVEEVGRSPHLRAMGRCLDHRLAHSTPSCLSACDQVASP